MRRSLNVRSAMRLGMFVSALVGLPAATSLAAITVDPVANDVSPTDPATWTNSTTAYVGKTDDGELTVDGGSQINSDRSYLGYNSGSTGTATVDGAGSTWNTYELHVGDFGSGSLNITNGGVVTASSFSSLRSGTATVTGTGSKLTTSGDLYVGRYGTGTLNIENGGEVTASDSYLGYYSGSTSTATVTGTGSKWTTSGDLYVGFRGTGTLTVADGGQVTAKTLYASLSDLHGNGTINANGIVSDVDLVFDQTHGLTQALAFGSGGTLNLTMDGSGGLCVGYKGTSTLRIADGQVVSSTDGYLGYHSGSTGTATVTGAGSKWTNSGELYVGNSGTGTLTIENGGVVASSSSSYLGYDSGSTGTATVTGLGSKWTTSGGLIVGCYGTGTLKIENGGTVSSDDAYLGLLPIPSSTSAVTVTGTGSKWTTSGKLYVGGFIYGGGTGTLTIENGGVVSSGSSYLGYYSGSTGTATVAGVGSQWINTGSLYVGYNGAGALSVADDGQVTTAAIYASLSDLHGNGTINANGIVSDVDLVFDQTHGLTQALSFGSGGTLNLTVDGKNALGVGYKGTGTLRIADGQVVSSTYSHLGYHSGSTGTAMVTGAGSKWISSSLYVGHYYGSTGMLTIENGGEVTAAGSEIGYFYGSGTATVTGAGSKWTNRISLRIGATIDFGTGTLNITRGGLVTAQSVYINNQSLLSMDIGFDSTLNINSGTGTLTNDGKVRFTTGANVAAGEYQPILAGTFAGSGIYQALGGTWDNTRHVFIVDAAETGSINDTINLDLASSRRAAITDATSGQTLVGASFLSGTGSISFAADELTSSEESALSLMLTAGSDLLAGYQFTVTGTTISSTNPVYLSLFVGRDYDEDTFKLWHYDGTAWTAFLPTDLSYDGQFASFTVTGFSGYAISGELIPEPASLGLLALSSVMLLMRRPSLKK